MNDTTTARGSGTTMLPLIVRDDRSWRGERVISIRSPWDESPVADVPVLSADELQDALDWTHTRAANCAAWPVTQRIAAMRAWAEAFARDKEELAQTETREMGKPIAQTRRIIDGIIVRIEQLCQARLTMAAPPVATEGTRSGARAAVMSLRDPFGVTAGILPFNSPVSALVWKIAPALLMGNAAVIKLSEIAPVAALRAAHLLAALPIPDGALQVVNGYGAELGPVISQHPAVRKISLTGGTAAGADVFRRSAPTFKRLTLECGSNDPAIILRDADLALAARTVADLGIRTYAGQICTAPKRCIVSREVYDGFEQMLAAEAIRTIIGDPLDPRTELGPLVSTAAAERVEQQVRDAVAAGARLVCGGERRRAVYAPTVLADVSPANAIFYDPAFGPVVSLIRAADEAEAIALANDSCYALRAAVFGRDVQRAAALARQLDCSGIAINGSGVIDCRDLNVEPRKMSGIGAEGITASLLEYSQPKFIWINDWWPQE